ncbi:MAG: acyl-CoA dehydrogenase family protein [Acidimicrobiia bacterium]
MDIELNSEDEMFRDELRTWLRVHLVGEFREHPGVGSPTDDSHWELRLAWERELVAGNWLNLTWPEQYGGRGGTLTQEIVFQIEHARARAPYWVGINGRDLLGPTLLMHGTDAQKQRFLPAIMRAEEFWGQGFSEPNAGSDLASLRTRAEPDGDGWLINGQKIWMTLGNKAHWMYVLCRTGEPESRHRGITMLLVDAQRPGVDVRPIRNIAGGLEFCEVFFDNARTSADLVVGEVNGGWTVAMDTLGTERVGAMLPYQATFEAEMTRLLDEVARRRGGESPVMRERLAKAWSGLQVLQYMNQRLLAAELQGRDAGALGSVLKIYWSRWHRSFGELMLDVFGPKAIVMEPGGEPTWYQRTFLNSRAETIYGGADEIQHNIVGERVLGLPREPR